MTNEQQETIADIVDEMRAMNTGWIDGYVVRIELAANREREAQCADCEIAKSEARLRTEERELNCYYYRQYEAQGKVMAATASQNVRLREALRKLLAVAKNRMPLQPTLDELEVMAQTESEVAK